MFSLGRNLVIGCVVCSAASAALVDARAQEGASGRNEAKAIRPRIASDAPGRATHRTANIHWQRVPLRDALARLHGLFDEVVFVDRRVDPNLRVSLDIDAASAEEVVAGIASGNELGVAQVGPIVYLGPRAAAEQLTAIIATRAQSARQLPADVRVPLMQKQSTEWARLSEPRRVIASVVEQRGWRPANEDAIPHDLWSAGNLPPLTLAEQLTLLLVGFDLTFEIKPSEQSIEIVPLRDVVKAPTSAGSEKRSPAPAKSNRKKQDSRQVYTLRVQEKPVGVVLNELSKRLHWAIQIDEDAIKKAGKSLDKRISFSVENADQEHLLEALLQPAGLDYQLEDDRVRIIPERYGSQ